MHVCNEEFEHLFGANTATDQQMLQKAFDAVDKNKAGMGSECRSLKSLLKGQTQQTLLRNAFEMQMADQIGERQLQ